MFRVVLLRENKVQDAQNYCVFWNAMQVGVDFMKKNDDSLVSFTIVRLDDMVIMFDSTALP